MTTLGPLLHTWIAAYRRERAARRAARELARLGPEILDDIGIPAHRLSQVAAELACRATPGQAACDAAPTHETERAPRPAAAILDFPAHRAGRAAGGAPATGACCAA